MHLLFPRFPLLSAAFGKRRLSGAGSNIILFSIILPLIPFFNKKKRKVGGPLRAQRDPSAHPCGGDIPRWQLRPDAGLCPTSPCGGYPVGQQEIHEHEALGGGSGRRLYCRLTSLSRSLQTILHINLDGTHHHGTRSTPSGKQNSRPSNRNRHNRGGSICNDAPASLII